MNDFNSSWGQGFDALSKQYWNAWSDMARQGSAQAPATDGWKQMLELWAPWARNGRSSIDDAVERMTTQGGAWFGQLQQVAQQFARGQANASDIVRSWKEMFGGAGRNPFSAVFPQSAASGMPGFEQWLQQVNPMLDNLRSQWSGALDMPAFGHAREQQERMQDFMQSQIDYRQAMAAYSGVLFKAGQRSFEVFENKLTERSEPGRQIDSARALFDLWIDAVEQAWSEIALSPDYRRVYGELANAQTRVRGGVQDMIERATAQFGMPTRTEVNSSHRKVTQLERDVRELKQRLVDLEARGSSARAGTARTAAPQEESIKSKTAKSRPVKSRTAKPASAKSVKSVKSVKAKVAPRKAAKRSAKTAAGTKVIMPKAPIPKAPGTASAKTTPKTKKKTTRKSAKR